MKECFRCLNCGATIRVEQDERVHAQGIIRFPFSCYEGQGGCANCCSFLLIEDPVGKETRPSYNELLEKIGSQQDIINEQEKMIKELKNSILSKINEMEKRVESLEKNNDICNPETGEAVKTSSIEFKKCHECKKDKKHSEFYKGRIICKNCVLTQQKIFYKKFIKPEIFEQFEALFCDGKYHELSIIKKYFKQHPEFCSYSWPKIRNILNIYIDKAKEKGYTIDRKRNRENQHFINATNQDNQNQNNKIVSTLQTIKPEIEPIDAENEPPVTPLEKKPEDAVITDLEKRKLLSWKKKGD